MGIYVGKHLSLLIWIPIVVGALILMCYFAFNAQYLPTISKDSVLYYAFATTILGVFIAFVASVFFLYPFYLISQIFYNTPRPSGLLSVFFALIYVLPIIVVFVIIVAIELGIGLTNIECTIVLFMWIGLAIGFLKIALHFHCEKILLFCLSSLLPLAFYLIVVQMFRFDSFGYFISFSVCMLICLICCIAVFIFEYFNMVKLSFVVCILCLVAIPFLLSSFIVSKLHIGNYAAKELIFTQEAADSIALCHQPTHNANNTLTISDVKVISSLGEYILFECNSTKERQKVPMRFLVGEILHPNIDKDKGQIQQK